MRYLIAGKVIRIENCDSLYGIIELSTLPLLNFEYNGDAVDDFTFCIADYFILPETTGVLTFSTELLTVYESNEVFSFTNKATNPDIVIVANFNEKYAVIYVNKRSEKAILVFAFMQMLRYVFETISALGGFISLHASLVSVVNEGICFTAKSGGGKSTQALLWEKERNAEIINHDRPMLRLRNDNELIGYGMPWSGSEQCFVQREIPISCIVVVDKELKNACYRVDNDIAEKVIFKRTSIPFWHSEACINVKNSIRKIVSNCSVIELLCTPDTGSIIALEKAMHSTCKYAIRKDSHLMKIKKGYVKRNIAGENIVIPVGVNANKVRSVMVLDGCASTIWDILQNGATQNEIVDELLKVFDVDKESADNDVKEFISKLKELDLVDDIL